MIGIKRLIYTVFLLGCMTMLGFGQNLTDGNRFEKIEAQKIAYITKHLNLTSSEAQRFFPVYNQYFKEFITIRNQKSKLAQSGVKNKSGNDLIEYDAKVVELKKEYRTKFAAVIGSSRASQFFVVEQEFRDMLYKEWQNRQK